MSDVTDDPSRYHFLHGVSPDGETLAFVDLPRGDFSAAGRLALIPSAGGETWYPDSWSPDSRRFAFMADPIERRTDGTGTDAGAARRP